MNFRREPSLQLKLNSTTFSPGVEGLIAFSDLLKDALKDVKQEQNTEVNINWISKIHRRDPNWERSWDWDRSDSYFRLFQSYQFKHQLKQHPSIAL